MLAVLPEDFGLDPRYPCFLLLFLLFKSQMGSQLSETHVLRGIGRHILGLWPATLAKTVNFTVSRDPA